MKTDGSPVLTVLLEMNYKVFGDGNDGVMVY